jgi:ketosteroid isomerase-like protein
MFVRLAALVSLILLGGATTSPAQTRAGNIGSVEQQVLAASAQWFEAVVRRDAASLERLLADDFVTLQPSPAGVGIGDKSSQLKAAAQPGGLPPTLRRSLTRTQVRRYGNICFLTALATFQVDGPSGAPTTNEALISELWRNERGGWRLSHYQTTIAPSRLAN